MITLDDMKLAGFTEAQAIIIRRLVEDECDKIYTETEEILTKQEQEIDEISRRLDNLADI